MKTAAKQGLLKKPRNEFEDEPEDDQTLINAFEKEFDVANMT
jgi:hypothetical protein